MGVKERSFLMKNKLTTSPLAIERESSSSFLRTSGLSQNFPENSKLINRRTTVRNVTFLF